MSKNCNCGKNKKRILDKFSSGSTSQAPRNNKDDEEEEDFSFIKFLKKYWWWLLILAVLIIIYGAIENKDEYERDMAEAANYQDLSGLRGAYDPPFPRQ